jgi:hypothetical protein
VARQQADRAHNTELALRRHKQRRAGWLEANAHLDPAYRQVLRELAWQRRVTGLAAEHYQPGYLREELGPVPESTRGRRIWRQAPPRSRTTATPTASLTPTRRSAPRRGSRCSGPPGSTPAPSGPRTASALRTARSERDRPAQPPITAAIQTPPTPEMSGRLHPGAARSGPPASTSEGGQVMARPQPPQPDPDDLWPSCEEQPPGISIRSLRHGDLQALLAHLDHHEQDDEDEGLVAGTVGRRPVAGGPVVAVRVRASVGHPGASAHAEYRRRRAAERATWTPSLPWRAGAVLAAGVAAGLLAAQVAPDLAGLLAVTVAAGLGWRLRFRPSTDTRAWRRGAAGERRTARLLAPLERRGWAVLHDLAIPGTQANLDHLVIGPGGVLVIDSKQYRGRLRLDPYGMVWHGRHLLVSVLRKVLWEADQADEILGIADITVAAIVAVHGASVPWGLLQADGVIIVPARRVADLLQALPSMLGPERVAWLADRARLRFHPAA